MANNTIIKEEIEKFNKMAEESSSPSSSSCRRTLLCWRDAEESEQREIEPTLQMKCSGHTKNLHEFTRKSACTNYDTCFEIFCRPWVSVSIRIY